MYLCLGLKNKKINLTLISYNASAGGIPQSAPPIKPGSLLMLFIIDNQQPCNETVDYEALRLLLISVL